MASIDVYNLISGKTYLFSLHYDLINDKDDKMPHYYEATFIEFIGKHKNVWKFKNFIDQETGKQTTEKTVKFLGLKAPSFELKTI